MCSLQFRHWPWAFPGISKKQWLCRAHFTSLSHVHKHTRTHFLGEIYQASYFPPQVKVQASNRNRHATVFLLPVHTIKCLSCRRFLSHIHTRSCTHTTMHADTNSCVQTHTGIHRHAVSHSVFFSRSRSLSLPRSLALCSELALGKFPICFVVSECGGEHQVFVLRGGGWKMCVRENAEN